MFITNTITKKALETIVHETFLNLGSVPSSSLLDSLKLLGFYYATNAGISINIEDLKTPNEKEKLIEFAIEEINTISKDWKSGAISDAERFQSIIDSWTIATESLKTKILKHYKNFDPTNNLHVMAFSGARGNISQVRQLIGMRGLMSDQEGKIIDLPIRANFREGLSSIDYMISSYGARKGIVDTALKTADSGYLTRRLIYTTQDLVIREIDCKSTAGVILLLNKKNNVQNIIGRVLNSAKDKKSKIFLENYKNTVITTNVSKNLKNLAPIILNLRSPLTCLANGSICQNCYGWDLAQSTLISLGEAVGIIAAQSIGEPGTQLTMRTFHTGGIYTSENVRQIFAPFSGKLVIPDTVKSVSYRTSHGDIVAKLQQQIKISIISWFGLKKDIILDAGSFLYKQDSTFVKKGALIADQSVCVSASGPGRLKPIYARNFGEIRFENLLLRQINRENKSKVKVNQEEGVLWVAAGKIFPLPKEAKYKNVQNLKINKSFAELKLCTPQEGVFNYTKPRISIAGSAANISFDAVKIFDSLTNCSSKVIIYPQNYQYVDKFTILATLNIYPNLTGGKIYSIRRKSFSHTITHFLITESDVWKLHSDQLKGNVSVKENKIFRARNQNFNNIIVNKPGILLKRDGLHYFFQKVSPYFLSSGTLLQQKQNDFVCKNDQLGSLVTYSNQTEDIVQGLPKIEELIEARVPREKAKLARQSGVLLNSKAGRAHHTTISREKMLLSQYIPDVDIIFEGPYTDKNVLKPKFTVANLVHSICSKSRLFLYDNNLWKAFPLPPQFIPIAVQGKNEFYFINNAGSILGINTKGKKISPTWSNIPLLDKKVNSYNSKNALSSEKYAIKNIISAFKNKKTCDCILELERGKFIYLELVEPIAKYSISLNARLLVEPGSYIDIGEPFTSGLIDPHELLNLLFHYHSRLDGLIVGSLYGVKKFQLILVNSILSIYESQNVKISSKHIEILARQMTANVRIKYGGDTPLLPGEYIKFSLMLEICKALGLAKGTRGSKIPKFEPIFLSATNASLSKDGFLSAAGFQETKRILTKAAIEGKADWLRGLKECALIGRLMPAGSAFLNYKVYLDNIYLFKD